MKNYSSVHASSRSSLRSLSACGGGSAPATEWQRHVHACSGGHRHRRVEHGVSGHRGRRRRISEAEHRHAGHGRPLRHRRRFPEVLPQRNRHLERVAADRGGRDRGVQEGRHRLHRAAGRLRRHGGRRESEEHLGDVDHGRRTEEAVGAGRARKGSAVEPGARRAGPIRKSTCSAPASTPARSTTSPKSSTARPRSAAATTRRARTTTSSCRVSPAIQNALGYMGLAYFEENKDKLKLVPSTTSNPANGAGPIAPSPETVRNGTYRPLSRPIFIYVNTAALAGRKCRSSSSTTSTSASPLVIRSRIRAADRRRAEARAAAVRGKDDRHDVRCVGPDRIRRSASSSG